MNNTNNICLSDIDIGATFKIGDVEFIKFFDIDGETVAVTRNLVFDAKFGENNNFTESDILTKLQKEFLPTIADAVGEENIIEFETDLTALDGMRNYGVMKSKVSLPTFDFYRNNREIFDKYTVDDWWWLATPDTLVNNYWISCVSPLGYVDHGDCYDLGGVRPFLRFKSSIFVSNNN